MKSQLFLGRTLALLLALSAARAATVDENTTGPSSGGDGFWGESFITPASSSFNNIVFTFLTNFSTNDPFATGTGFLLSTEYLGPPSGLSNTTPGFLGQATASGNLYTFAPSITLAPNTTYYFYENASIPSGTIFGGNAYAGHQFYYSSASGSNFGGAGIPLNFRVTGVATTCASAPPNMTAWWRADGNADDSVGGHNGSLLKNATFAAGEVNQAFSFDGSGAHVAVGDIDLAETFTIDAWINPASLAGANYLIAKDDGNTTSYAFQVQANGQLIATVQSGSGLTLYQTDPGVVTTGTWQHVALTYDGNAGALQKFTFYVNGVVAPASLNGANDAGGTPANNAASATIGIFSNGSSFPFNGLIDEFEIFGRVLSADEIARIYLAGPLGKCKCTPPPTSMVSWWPGENDANDLQGNSDGTLQGGMGFAAGKVGQAFSFDGTDDYVAIPNESGYDNLTDSITVDAWVKVTAFTSDFAPIVAKGDTAWRLQRNFNTNTAAFGTSGLTNVDLNGVTNINDGDWHHIAGVYDGSNKYLYVDGVLDASIPATGAISQNDFAVEIGHNSEETSRFWNGLIDEAEVIHRALSPEEVAAIYLAGSAGKCRPCTPAPSGMVSWWPGDENANDIQGSNNGTLKNGASFAGGKVGGAFNLDGVDDYVEVADSPNLNPGSEISVDAWIYLNSDSDHNIIVNKDNGDNKRDYLFQIVAGGQLSFVVFGSSGIDRAEITGGSLSTNTWYHVAGTYDQQTIRIYVNGAEVEAAAFTNDLNDSDQPFGIGQTNGDPTNRFHGLIDEVEIFNRALSQSDVQSIYDAGSGGKCKPSVPAERQFLNISSRADVGTGENVAIGGFIIHSDQGTTSLRGIRVTTPTKLVLIRGIGPSLGITGQLEDPFLELRDSDGALIISNDNWGDAANAGDIPSGLVPSDPDEAAILRTLDADSTYTAILSGAGETTGIGLVEVYDLDALGASHLANISTRAFVSTGPDVLIGGIIVQGGIPTRVVLRGIGPSLTGQGVSSPLLDPFLELHDGNGALLETNDDWAGSPEAVAITASGLAPTHNKESAILFVPAPGAYTAIVSGVGDTTGIGLVEAYNIGP